MPDWLLILLLIVVVLIVLIAVYWWWTHRQPRPGVTSAAAARPGASGPYGAGSAAPLADGSAPAGYAIKGNADSMLFHAPESPYYGRTKAEAWFRTEADAVRAGFTRWDANKPD